MPLSWNEIRSRAANFAEDWQNAHYEKGQTQTFYNEFFEVFGRRRRDVALYEQKVKKLNNAQGFIDLFWPGKLLIEQKSAGRNLEKAREQATDYCLNLKPEERPRYVLLSDFQSFQLLDLEQNEEYHFPLSQLAENIRPFGFIAGYQLEQYPDQPEVNIQAASLMGNLHARLEESGYTGKDLEKLLVRLMFCLFADDTGVFTPDSLLNYIEISTNEDGRNLGGQLRHVFEILNTPEINRQKILDEDLAAFPYINGRLFEGGLLVTPSFNSAMRQALLACCRFDWGKVSPALFGSLFQMVMLPAEQRKGGAHYTSERNILKTINPLFMDELKAEFAKIRDSKSTQRKSQLEKFHEKLGTLTFFDPACGCGNFLILAYRELRLLEIEVLKELYPTRQLSLDVKSLSKVDVDQFYGIEIEEFAAHIAETAMWITDHQMNMRLGETFGRAFPRIPLKKSAHIFHGNALTKDWKEIIEPKKLSYMLGNPPFVGKKEQGKRQKEEMALVFGNAENIKLLDYVTAWYWKAAQFIQKTNVQVAFVSTNSITQGEQVAVLWQPLISKYKIHINFAHRTFKWTIDEKKAKGMTIAAVHCVIIGFSAKENEQKYIFEYETVKSEPHRIEVKNLNPYLVEANNFVITSRRSPISNNAPKIIYGSIGIDDGHLLFDNEVDKNNFLAKEPSAASFIKKYLGGNEYINDISRYCLWLKDALPEQLRNMKEVHERTSLVKKFRLASNRPETKKLATQPWLFGEIRQPDSDYLMIPKVSSETRSYIPIGYCNKDIIANGSSLVIPDAKLYHFGILTSAMHNSWMRHTAGRMKSDYQYSASIVYNNFPWPSPTPAQTKKIEEKAQAVLDARAEFKNSTLADLYDPLVMPIKLLKTHQELDKAVDAAYRKEAFASERNRIEYLFELYQKLDQPLLPAITTRKTRKG